MSCMIERLAGGENMVVLRVCGRIRAEHVRTLKELIRRKSGAVALDLTEVTLVAREAVTFLAACELKSIEVRNCPAFLREWIDKEQYRIAAEPSNTASGSNDDPEGF